MGKDWSKGLSAKADPRIARAAAAHRGMTYRRHVPFSRDRRVVGGRTLALGWSARMAYVVGLIATDGCLVNTGRHVAFTTCDRQLAETFLTCLGRPLRYGRAKTAIGNDVFRVQIGDVELYRWLETVGLHRRKSLTLGAIDVPDEQLLPLVRGLLDGDGTISNFTHHATPGTYPNYVYERLLVRFFSASRAHIDWLRSRLCTVCDLNGWVTKAKPRAGRHDYFTLTYGKHASIALLQHLYADEHAPRLERKYRIWRAYSDRQTAPTRAVQLGSSPT